MAQAAIMVPQNTSSRRREPATVFKVMAPLTEEKTTILGSLSRIGQDLKGRVKGVVKAVKAEERDEIGTPIPPEVVISAYGPLFFKTKS